MTTRVQMPAEFFDRTSAQLLVKPEPKYFYATTFLNALGAELPIPDAMGHPGRELSGVGADYSNTAGTLMLQADGLSEEIFAAKINFEGEPGHTVRLNRPVFADTTYTQLSRTVGTNTTISTVPVTIGSEQTALTIQRFAGPYDNGNARVAPFAIDQLDSQMGVHKVSKIVGTHLSRDFHKFIDSAMVVLANTGTSIFPDGFSATSDFNTAGGSPLSYEYVCNIENAMDEANLPTFSDGFRVIVIPPCGSKALKKDHDFQRLSEFHKEKNALFPATYLTSVGKLHVFKSNTLTSTPGSGSVKLYRIHAIAPGAFGAGMGKVPQVAYSNDDNYGLSAKVIWVANLAFAMLDASFVRVGYCTDTF